MVELQSSAAFSSMEESSTKKKEIDKVTAGKMLDSDGFLIA